VTEKQWAKTATATLWDGRPHDPRTRLFASPLHTACRPLHLCQPFRNGAPVSFALRNSGCICK
jgi:hypothetical protein